MKLILVLFGTVFSLTLLATPPAPAPDLREILHTLESFPQSESIRPSDAIQALEEGEKHFRREAFFHYALARLVSIETCPQEVRAKASEIFCRLAPGDQRVIDTLLAGRRESVLAVPSPEELDAWLAVLKTNPVFAPHIGRVLVGLAPNGALVRRVVLALKEATQGPILAGTDAQAEAQKKPVFVFSEQDLERLKNYHCIAEALARHWPELLGISSDQIWGAPFRLFAVTSNEDSDDDDRLLAAVLSSLDGVPKKSVKDPHDLGNKIAKVLLSIVNSRRFFLWRHPPEIDKQGAPRAAVLLNELWELERAVDLMERFDLYTPAIALALALLSDERPAEACGGVCQDRRFFYTHTVGGKLQAYHFPLMGIWPGFAESVERLDRKILAANERVLKRSSRDYQELWRKYAQVGNGYFDSLVKWGDSSAGSVQAIAKAIAAHLKKFPNKNAWTSVELAALRAGMQFLDKNAHEIWGIGETEAILELVAKLEGASAADLVREENLGGSVEKLARQTSTWRTFTGFCAGLIPSFSNVFPVPLE